MTFSSTNLRKKNGGFTLVELIVVIGIISLLSSIVMTGVDIARLKARDAALLSSVNNLRTSLEQEYVNAGNYGALLGTGAAGVWIQKKEDCDSANFGGSFGGPVTAMCKKIISDTKYPNDLGISPGSLWIGPGYSNTVSPSATPKDYTIMVYLPGVKKFYCYGYDGNKSSVEDGSTIWGQPGCWSNY
jgi:prepilin-type N-terminal cleavage/methylation domain-containing protein